MKNSKYSWKLFALCAAVVAAFLILTFFKTEHAVPYDEAMEHITLVDVDSAIVVVLNYSKGTVYAYNDAHFGTEGDNIYIVYKQSLFDRWFGKELNNYRTVVVRKCGSEENGYDMPRLWYYTDDNNPFSDIVPINDKITYGDSSADTEKS